MEEFGKDYGIYFLIQTLIAQGENEIDIIAEDELDNKIEFIEVKRQAKNFDENILKAKSELFFKAVGPFKGYEVIYRGLSTEDM